MGDIQCYDGGHVTSGNRQMTLNIACPTSQPATQTWLDVTVVVEEGVATSSTYLDGQLVTSSQPMQHPIKPRAGIVIHRGYNDHIRFKNLRVQSVYP